MKRIAVICISAWLLVAAGPAVHGDSSFTTQDLARAAQSPDCLDWKIDGICFWLRCDLFGCRVVTSPRVSHRLPDLVVQSHIEPSNPPWREWQPHARAAAETTLSGARLGTGLTGAINRNRFSHMLNYFEVDVVGNPVADLSRRISGRFLCRSDVSPFHPYLSAAADADTWRSTGIEESRNAQDYEQREVGISAESTWGPMQPRTGFVLQPHPAKAAAVTAARGIDIVTRHPGEHVATPYKASESARSMRRGDPKAPDPKSCSDSGGVWRESRNESGCHTAIWRQWRSPPASNRPRWQMLTPEPAQQCRSFGTPPPPSSAAVDGRYAWHYWQRYRCCRKRGIFIGETGL